MLRGDEHSSIPYFTRFGQNQTPHPLLVMLAKLAYQASGAQDIVGISRALGGNQSAAPPPGTLLGMRGPKPKSNVIPLRPDSLPDRFVTERLQNGLIRLDDRKSGLVQMFNEDGTHRFGPRIFNSLKDVPRMYVQPKNVQKALKPSKEGKSMVGDHILDLERQGKLAPLRPQPKTLSQYVDDIDREPMRVMENAERSVQAERGNVRQLEAELRKLDRQVTNRDVPSSRQMAPKARPVAKRKTSPAKIKRDQELKKFLYPNRRSGV